MELRESRKNRSGIMLMTFSIIAAGIMLFSCDDYTYEPPAIDDDKVYSFSDDIKPILKNCAGCHPAVSEPDLTAGNAYGSLTDGGYINTETPEESPLLKKLADGHAGINESSPQYIEILGWITQGAKNN